MDELANAITHGLGLALALVGAPVLIALAVERGTIWHVIGVSIYGATLIVLYAASTIYHTLGRNGARPFLRLLDHCAIYLLIAGTYTPFSLISLGGPWGWTLLALVWSMAVFGICWKLFHSQPFHRVSTPLYAAMGWSVLIAAKPVMHALPLPEIAWIAAGGVAYTGGIIFLGLERRHRLNHAVWHVCVMAGSICHFVAVARYVLPHPAL
jgi:hemolysin III